MRLSGVRRSAYDAIVIGGGVMGSSISYHLALAGARVALFERRAIGAEASGASAGGVRQQHRHAWEMPLALSSIRRWAELAAELDAELSYRRLGGLRLVRDEAEAAELKDSIRRQNELGLTDLVWLDTADCHEVVPFLGPGFVGGSYCPSDGHADPTATTMAFARQAHRLGAEVRVGETIACVIRKGDAVTGVRLDSGEVAMAPWVVNASGAWGATLGESIGVDVPIRARVPQMLATMPAPRPLLSPVVSLFDTAANRALSLKQVADGGFMLGGGWPSAVDDEGGRPGVSSSNMVGARAMAASILPVIADLPIERIWFGTEAQSRDGLPVLGAAPGVDGFVLALGFSGHGFAIAPAVGEAIADVVTGMPARHPIAPFSIERFWRTGEQPVESGDISAG